MSRKQVIELDALVAAVRDRGRSSRSVTAIAGAPGAGKSTLSEHLAEALNAAEPGSAAVFPMDGYHYDDLILNARGWRPRKGAPHTFDVAGFAHMLMRLRADTGEDIAVPVFDRSIEIARNAARIIPGSVRYLIVEGNYLLLDQAPWDMLAPLFDTTVYLEVPLEELRRRLEERWAWMTGQDRNAKLEGNDLPNAELVVTRGASAEFVVRNY